MFGCQNSGNPADSRDMTRMDRELREQNLEMLEFLRKYMPGYKDCWVEQESHRVGVRASRRIFGLETIAEETIFGEITDTPVALCWRHTGGHSNGKKFESSWARHKKGVAGVPMKTLIPKAFENVLVAGRCISGKFKMIDSYRMMDTCMTMGEAAGLLAYLAVSGQRSTHDLTYDELLPLMKENGFILSPRHDE